MYDDDSISVTSSDPLSGGSEYTDHTGPSDKECVCKLSVKFLLEYGRWVGNARNLYQPVGHCNSFHEEINNDYFPSLLGGKCVEVGEISENDEIEEQGVNLEYDVEERNIQCLACAEDGKYTTFTMYQSVLRFERAQDGHERPRLVSITTFVLNSLTLKCLGVVYRLL